MPMKVKEVADLVGISVRTLHHYDEIGLLSPKATSEKGYRLYSDNELERLQQILFFKELGFSLKEIKEILNSSSFNREEALQTQRLMLLEKRKRINTMIETIEKTIQSSKEEIKMTNEEKFKGLDFRRNPYEQEARNRWGELVIGNSLTKEGEEKINQLYRNLAAIRHLSPASNQAQNYINQWFEYVNRYFGTYTLEAFKGLGELYVLDARFTKNIDQFGNGLAQFMSEAMAIYSNSPPLKDS
ncbi:MerR family transcriptional regulator [Alkalihalobacillus sp. LMS39]|uniref:MerR family transcriptional regulator n=1 Tax=Alkalihalobacillus sp. LMS39 TaxID=2924032 RepID=UPI001FB4EC90|nr:MerR family transcriptional regulator [Alkalihalobacillus sp. LMS39]UOE96133.1 MerR family transcriptional regulator [Alkalihalobacillus sp. LMS39]